MRGDLRSEPDDNVEALEKITVADAMSGKPGYVVLCVSFYTADIQRAARIVKQRGGNRSSVLREALVRMEKDMEAERAAK